MPMCPNCGSWVPEGSSTCSCGTPEGDFANVPDEVDAEEIKKRVSDEIILYNKSNCLKAYGEAYLAGEYSVESDFLKETLDFVGNEKKNSFNEMIMMIPIIPDTTFRKRRRR